MTKCTAFAAFAALVLAAPPAGAAASFYAAYMSRPDGTVPCYARTYDERHLAAHPEQRVAHFYLTLSAANDAASPKSFDVAFGFIFRDPEVWHAGEAGCAAKGDGAHCYGEGDVGEFTLVPRKDGLLVEIVRMETEETGADLASSDDREFRLYESQEGECFYEGSGGGSDDGDGSPVLEPLTPSISRPG
jgi:hypothetical protein